MRKKAKKKKGRAVRETEAVTRYVVALTDVMDARNRHAIIYGNEYEVVDTSVHGDAVVLGEYGERISLCPGSARLGIKKEFALI